MSNVLLSNIYTTFQTQKTLIALKVNEWSGRVWSQLNLILEHHLKDPQFASAAVFVVNFLIIELAERVTKLVKFLFLKNLIQHQKVETVYSLTMRVGIIVAGNLALMRMITLPIHPLVVSALAMASWITRWLLISFLNETRQPQHQH